MTASDREVVRFGVFELDRRARELRKQGRRVRLQDKPYELLLFLLAHPGELVTREQLRAHLWPADTFVVFDDSLNTAVRKVRDALGDAAEGSRFVETVPRRGYRFIGPIATDATVAAPVIDEPVVLIPPAPVVIEPSRSAHLPRTAAVAAAAIIGSALVAALWFRHTTLEGTARVTFQISAPDGLKFPNDGTSPLATVSPDGRRVAFITETALNRVYQIWIHDLEVGTTRLVPGTDNAWMPFWSPDGSRLGFQSSGALRIVDADGERMPMPIAELSVGDGASWGVNGDIIFANAAGGLSRATFGRNGAAIVTVPDHASGERRHLFPQILPDGRTFMYFALYESSDQSGVFLSSLNAPQVRRRVLTSRTTAMYAPPDYLLYVNDEGTLLAQHLDLSTGNRHGQPIHVASGVAVNYANGRVRFSASENGVIVYSGQSRARLVQPTWFDRAGRKIDEPLPPDYYTQFEISRDGRYLAAQRFNPDDNEPDIHVTDLVAHRTWRATDNPANDESPVWAADSQHFVYARHDGIMQPAQLVVHGATPAATERTVFRSGDSKHPVDWSSDGRLILYRTAGVSRKSDIWVVASDGGSPPVPVLASDADEIDARFSPDGRFIAYVSDESGQFEVYVRSVRPDSPHWMVSNGGGAQPRWRIDGQELVYVSAANDMMAVRVRSEVPFAADPPRQLFSLNHMIPEPFTRMPYAMSAGGQRFLIAALIRESANAPINVIVHWPPASAVTNP